MLGGKSTSEVKETRSETSIRLNKVVKTHFPCFVDNWLFNNDFVLNIVDEVEGKIVGGSNSEHLQLVEGAVSEEVRSVCHVGKVCQGGTNVVLLSLCVDDVVESVVLVLSELGIKGEVGHSIVRVTIEVSKHVVSS